MKRNYLLFITLFLGSSALCYDADFSNKILEEWLKGCSFTLRLSEDMPLPDKSDSLSGCFSKCFGKYKSNFEPIDLTSSMKRVWSELGFVTLENSAQHIDHTTLSDLEVIRPSSSVGVVTVLSQVTDNALSVIGKKRGMEMICMPLCDIAELSRRREIISLLAQDEALLHNVNILLDTMKKSEPYVIDFYGKNSLPPDFDQLSLSPILKQVFLDESPLAVTYANLLSKISSSPLLDIAYDYFVLRGLLNPDAAQINFIYNATKVLFLVAPSVHILLSNIDAVMRMQECVIGFATYVRAAKELMLLLEAHPQLAQLLPEVRLHLVRLNGNDQQAPKKFEYLNDLLQKRSTFNSNDPSPFSSSGNILVTYKYLSDTGIRKGYVPLMNTIGELDVYAALANKVRSHASKQGAQICFVDFIEDAKKPVLEIKDFWNPFIAPEKVVLNSMTLNTDRERNIIITGPNTGGKSTNMKSIAISVLLAQTFGIAPASSMCMTPFNQICTYLNVIDNTSLGLSLFKAEVRRIQETLDVIKHLPSNQYAFFMFDEIFTGTCPESATVLSYKCMKKFSEYENLIFVSATHFKQLTELEQVTNGAIRNYQVEAITDDSGKVVAYTYKIVPGISRVNSAQQVVLEAGLSI